MSLKKLLECIFCSNRIFSEYCVDEPSIMCIYIHIYVCVFVCVCVCVCVWNITAIWYPHAVKSRNCKLVFTPCWITETSPVSHAALSFGAHQHQFKASVLYWLSIGSGRDGDLSLQTNVEQQPKTCHISHSPARTKETQSLAVYNKFKNSRGCGRLICLLGLTLSERAPTRVNSVVSELLLNKSPPGVMNLKPPLRIA